MNLDLLSQFLILCLGGASIWLVSRRESWNRWGFVIGLLSQPFWFYTTLEAKQYGVFLLNLWYTYSFCQGIYYRFGVHALTETAEAIIRRLPRSTPSMLPTPDQLALLVDLGERLGLDGAVAAVRQQLLPVPPLATPHRNGWIGIDLDGTLAWDDGFHSAEHIGPPVPKMAARVRQYIAEGKDVRIFTARVDGGAVALAMGFTEGEQFRDVARIRTVIQDYTEKHFGKRLPVTNVKDFGMRELYDDRAVQILTNTGERADGIEDMRESMHSLAGVLRPIPSLSDPEPTSVAAA